MGVGITAFAVASTMGIFGGNVEFAGEGIDHSEDDIDLWESPGRGRTGYGHPRGQ